MTNGDHFDVGDVILIRTEGEHLLRFHAAAGRFTCRRWR
jgi:hypothetical protein